MSHCERYLQNGTGTRLIGVNVTSVWLSSSQLPF